MTKAPFKILLVDDETSIHGFVKHALGEEPCIVDNALNAAEAFQKLEKSIPDLMILDVWLPGVDGHSILKSVRAERRYDDMSVVMMSAQDDLNSKVRGLDMGAADFLVKPIQPQELAARVRSFIRSKEKRDESLAEYQHLATLSLTDPLTGAYNRRAMDRLLKARLAESVRYKIPISCLMFDIDHFKLVNDEFGHGVGDRVLKEIALLPIFRQEDALIRYFTPPARAPTLSESGSEPKSQQRRSTGASFRFTSP
jgi:PleD family two-component response regulator